MKAWFNQEGLLGVRANGRFASRSSAPDWIQSDARWLLVGVFDLVCSCRACGGSESRAKINSAGVGVSDSGAGKHSVIRQLLADVDLADERLRCVPQELDAWQSRQIVTGCAAER